jgi:hypothetical protein
LVMTDLGCHCIIHGGEVNAVLVLETSGCNV